MPKMLVGLTSARNTSYNLPCLWIGPTWGDEGGPFFKTHARVRQLDDTLKTPVTPCTYVDSLTLAKPGEWPTFDGAHHTAAGYQRRGHKTNADINAALVILRQADSSVLPVEGGRWAPDEAGSIRRAA